MLTISHMIGHLRLGAGRYVVDTAIEQHRRQGHLVNVLVSCDAEGNWRSDPALVEELEHHGIHTVTAGDFFHRDLPALRTAASTVVPPEDGRRPWLLHAHTAMAAAAGRWAGADAVVCTCHGWDLQRPGEFNLQDALALHLCDAVTSPSAFWARKIEQEFGIPSPSVIPVGLNLFRYPRLRRTGGAGAPCKIVTVCELTARKGVDLLIEAMPAIWQRRDDVELHIIGDGDAASDLRSLAGHLEHDRQRIHFHGPVAAPFERLQQFDLFALASRSDNLPVALIEAMLARLPLVTTAVGGIPELIEGGQCGILVDAGSASALAAGVLCLLADECRSSRLAQSGETFARDRFNIETTAAMLERLYEKTLCRITRARRQAWLPAAAANGAPQRRNVIVTKLSMNQPVE